jgi:cytochrome P450
MTLYPRVMKKAQQELDSVVGAGRLPTFANRPSLLYLEALFTELFRWHTPGPMSKFDPGVERCWLLTEVL